MAVEVVAETAWAYATTNFTPSLPSGVVDGDLIIVLTTHKYGISDFNSTPLAYWRLSTGGSNSVTEAGTEDTGDIRSQIFARYYDGTDGGAFTVASANVVGYRSMVLRSTEGRNLVYSAQVAADDTPDTTVSGTITAPTDIVATGGVIVGLVALNGTVADWDGAPSLSKTGTTFGTISTDDDSTLTGTNLRVRRVIAPVTSSDGVSSVATLTQTVSGTTTDLYAVTGLVAVAEVQSITRAWAGSFTGMNAAGGSFTSWGPQPERDGDLRVLTIYYKHEGVTITPPAGWTLLERSETTGYAEAGVDDVGDVGIAVYYRVADGVNDSWSYGALNSGMRHEVLYRSPLQGSEWVITSDAGVDTDGGATVTLSAVGLVNDDGTMLHATLAINQDLLQIGTPTASQTSATLGTADGASVSTSSGSDIEMGYWSIPGTAGPGSGTTTVEWALTSSNANNRAAMVALLLEVEEFIGTATSTFPALTQAAAGTVATPSYDGVGASIFPALTQSATGTHVAPTFSATATSTFPALSQAATGTVADPVDTGTVTSSFPALTQAAAGTVADPVSTGTAASTFAALTQAATGTFEGPVGSGFVTSVFAALAQSASGTHTPPVFTATAASTFPALAQGATATWTDPVDTGVITSTFAALSQSATGTYTPPGRTGTVASTFAAFVTVAEGPVTGPRAFELFAIAVLARHQVLAVRRRHGEVEVEPRHHARDVDRRWGTLSAQTRSEITS